MGCSIDKNNERNFDQKNRIKKTKNRKIRSFHSTRKVSVYKNIILMSTGQPVETMIIKSDYFAYRQFMGFVCAQVFVPVIIESVH